MHTQYPLSSERRARILRKVEAAMQRHQTALKSRPRDKALFNRTARWWAVWMAATGIRQF